MNKIFETIRIFNEEYMKKWKSRHIICYTNAIAGEAGELCNTAKHFSGGGTNSSKIGLNKQQYKDEIMAEIADIIIYCCILTMTLNLNHNDLVNSIHKKLKEVRLRKENERKEIK